MRLIEIPDDGIVRIPIMCYGDTVGEKRIDLSHLPTITEDELLAKIAELEAELKEERHRHDRYVDFELDEAKELQALREKNRWIPVEERLPDPFQTVLTYEANHDTIQEAYLTYQNEWVGVIMSGTVTHWKERNPPQEVSQ